MQCAGAIHATFASSCSTLAIRPISSGFAGSRCVPPTTRWIGLPVTDLAVSTIFSIVGWLHPTIRTIPSGVSIASDISMTSRSTPQDPFNRIRWKPGAISVVSVTHLNLPCGQALPNSIFSGGLPSK